MKEDGGAFAVEWVALGVIAIAGALKAASPMPAAADFKMSRLSMTWVLRLGLIRFKTQGAPRRVRCRLRAR
jgi:hypothetical protein